MAYQFSFGWLAITIRLRVVGAICGVALGIVCARARALVVPCVGLIRNTPFTVQPFFIFFGLPGGGIRLPELTAANLAMVINLGAYGCEIICTGIQASPRGQYEAGASLAMRPFQTFRHAMLVADHAERRVPRGIGGGENATKHAKRSRKRQLDGRDKESLTQNNL